MRAQIEHSFTFIMLILIAGVVLLFGYRMIGGDGGILSQSCEIEEIELKQTIEDYLQSYSKYGSVQKKSIPSPCDAQAICFADASLFKEPNSAGVYAGSPLFVGSNIANPIITAEIQAPSTPPNNVFLINKDGATVPLQLWSEKVSVNEILCVNATAGNFRLTFKGQGLKTVIERS